MICIYSSLQLLPLGDAITMFFTIPLFTMVFAYIILGTAVKGWKIGFGFLLIVGVVLIVRPPFIFPDNKDNVTLDPFWDYHADDTRGNSSVVLFSGEFWSKLIDNGKFILHL